MLLSSQNNDGLYVLFKSSATSIPQDFWSSYIFATTNMWHRQLGHLASCILNFLVSKNKIVCTSRHSLTQCQVLSVKQVVAMSLEPMGHKTTTPLDLMFSDVWGPAPMFSFDDFYYFSIFIDVHIKHI